MRREPVYLGGPSEHTLWGELKSIGLWGVISRRYALSLFLAVFAAPTIWAVLYYGVISSDRYISEAKFIVRGLNGNQVGGLSVLLRTFGISRANEDSYAIKRMSCLEMPCESFKGK